VPKKLKEREATSFEFDGEVSIDRSGRVEDGDENFKNL